MSPHECERCGLEVDGAHLCCPPPQPSEAAVTRALELAAYARGRADALRDAVAVLRKCSEGQPRDGWMFGVEWSIEKLEAMR